MDKIPDIFRHITIAQVIKHGKIKRHKTTFFGLSAVAGLRDLFTIKYLKKEDMI